MSCATTLSRRPPWLCLAAARSELELGPAFSALLFRRGPG